MVSNHRPTKVIVDLEAIQANLHAQKAQLAEHQEIFAVVKANAYGHGAVPVAYAAKEAGATGFCVATIDEGVELRQAGLTEETILVLGVIPSYEAVYAAQYDLSVATGQIEFLHEAQELLAREDQKLKVHLALDTGMGRIGVSQADELQALVTFLEHSPEQFDFEGVFTHFAQADAADTSYYQKQVAKFNELVTQINPQPKYVHSANSATAQWHGDNPSNVVRMGISLYGLNPSGHELQPTTALKPALSLVSELAFVKKVPQGTALGYGSTYVSPSEEWIGTIPLGYADGWLRRMQGFEILIAGQKCPIVGRVCMDQLMVRLPGKLAVGSPVTLIGRDGDLEITAQDVADYAQTISYEVLCNLTDRLPRVYRGN